MQFFWFFIHLVVNMRFVRVFHGYSYSVQNNNDVSIQATKVNLNPWKLLYEANKIKLIR